VARRGQRSNAQKNGQKNGQRRQLDNEGIIPQLARAVREVEHDVQRNKVTGLTRTKFQVVALLAREERARVKVDPNLSEGQRAEELKRLDGVGTILAKTGTRHSTLLALLDENAEVGWEAKDLMKEMQQAAGLAVEDDEEPAADPEALAASDKQVVPPSVLSRRLANPFLAPDFSNTQRRRSSTHRLAGWELIEPLLESFERAADGNGACMPLPEETTVRTPVGLDLMNHQARLVGAAEAGHRSFLLADEPGLGKTAQSLLAAQAADAFPLLVVVPNVVKANWAREAGLWTPSRVVTVVHGNGDDVNGYADIVVINYEILDRHVGWLGDFGFGGMVVDEAHFIKNKSSQRSQHVLHIADRIRALAGNPLMLALTGTPLINDIEDFRAIWQFLGWIDEKKPRARLMDALEENALTPIEPQFYPAARRSVIDLGIVRRRKVDVASDIPARRIADIPVELDDEVGRSIRDSERELARRLLERYDMAIATRRAGQLVEGIDHALVRQVATWEREDSDTTSDENVFGMMRRIGQAKAVLAGDYAAQLARNVGKVVFFAKHIDVMDAASDVFERRGLRYTSIRGNQTPKQRAEAIDGFVNDPDVAVIVCSLSAAGVGINLQVSSNVVLAELSWTDAEQTQAIDRVHRIGQEMPVTAWRIIAAQTIDTRIAELIDSKAGLAARALDGSDEGVGSSVDVQLEALVTLLTDALEKRAAR